MTVTACATTAEWLAYHAATKCPDGTALGLSQMERHFNTAARDSAPWVRQIGADIAADRQNRLRSGKKSRT